MARKQATRHEDTPVPAAAPEPVTVTDAEALQFLYDGRQRLTALGVAARQLREWTEVFERRGGAAVYGDDALEIVYFSNDVQALLDANEAAKRATIARLRTDI